MELSTEQIKAIAAEVVTQLAPMLRKDDEMISPERASSILNCQPGTLRKYVREGKIKDNGAGRGGKLLYDRASVREYSIRKKHSHQIIN